jgi:hypothetical protein
MKARLPCVLVWFVLCTLLGTAQPAWAATSSGSGWNGSQPSLPLQSLLNPDGTLNLTTGFSGSLDADGWRMSAGPDGEPRFTPQDAPPADPAAPAIAGDEYWDDLFGLGAYYPDHPESSCIWAIAVDGANLYVGGAFEVVGSIPARGIARWDGAAHRWSALGGGVDGLVLAITVHGDGVYAGGIFQHAGDVDAVALARWSKGAGTWSAVGEPLGATSGSVSVLDIAVSDDGDLTVGGKFDQAGGVAVHNIARWNGSEWDALGGGVTGGADPEVLALAVSGDDLYVGGRFTHAGGAPAPCIARWNGSAWSSVGQGVDAPGEDEQVNAILIYGSYLYVGGAFDSAIDAGGAHPAGNIAAWNGAWLTLNGGLDGAVWALAIGPDGRLYAGGQFEALAGGATSARRLAVWDGSGWGPVGGLPSIPNSDGLDSLVLALAAGGSDVIVGGLFTTTNDGKTLNHIARWNTVDEQWVALGDSVNAPVGAIAFHGDDVFFGGVFTSAGGVPAMRIARWNRRTGEWSALGSGLSGCTGGAGCVPAVYAIAVDGDDVYVGGNFINAGDVIGVNGIAHWNIPRGKWYRLGSGVTCGGMTCGAEVRAISIADHHVFVGGYFDHVNGVALPAHNVALWSVSGWEMLGTGLNGPVYALSARTVDKVFAGGAFTSPQQYIALWNGGSWINVGNGLNGAVRAMAWTSSSTLAIGGFFVDAGGDAAADHIATLKDGSWKALGDGLNYAVYALGWTGERLCAGGTFTASGVLGLTRVACFRGATWSPLGSGADSIVYALGYGGGKLYAGGLFLNAGGKPSVHLGRWGVDRVCLPLTMKQ